MAAGDFLARASPDAAPRGGLSHSCAMIENIQMRVKSGYPFRAACRLLDKFVIFSFSDPAAVISVDSAFFLIHKFQRQVTPASASRRPRASAGALHGARARNRSKAVACRLLWLLGDLEGCTGEESAIRHASPIFPYRLNSSFFPR
jgi:hypothetical protein